MLEVTDSNLSKMENRSGKTCIHLRNFTEEVNKMLHIAGTVCAFTLTETTLSIDAPEDSADLAPFPALFPLEFSR